MPRTRTGHDRGARRPRGRPPEFEREAAVRAAMDAFWTRGFEAVTAIDLADAMAITRSSLYNAFGDRETVFREALQAYRQAAPDAAFAGLRPGQPVTPLVRKVFRTICRVRAADPEGRGCLVVNSVAELVGAHDDLGRDLATAMDNNLRVYERLVTQAVEQGEISGIRDVRAAAQVLLAFVSGVNVLSKVIRDERALWGMCREFLDRFGFRR